MDRTKNNRIYYERHRDVLRKKSKKYYQNHKEERVEYDNKYRLLNLDKKKEYFKKYYKENKERIKKHQHENPHIQLKANTNQLKRFGILFDMSSMKFSYALKSWSKMIKKLDNNICKLCDSKGKLHSHHIKPKALFPKLSLQLNNGITLCVKCHSKTHGFELY